MHEHTKLQELLRGLKSMSADAARTILLEPTSPAPLMYLAAHAFYGPTVAAYEPDTLWTMLDVPVMNRDKLLAALTLDVSPSFYWDLRVFGHTCLAFNDQAVHVERVPQPLPEHIVSAIIDAQLIFQLDSDVEPVFDDEVAAYVAACFVHEGLTYAPPLVSFAQDHVLRLLSPEGRKLGAEMKVAASEEHPSADPESALGVQLARYHQMMAYLDMRRHMFGEAVRKLRSPDSPRSAR